VGSLLGWQFTLAQTAKYTADGRMFPKLFAKISGKGAPIAGIVVCGILQTLMAFSTMSPNATAQFNKLVSLAAVTNIIPYVTSLSGLLIIMYKAKIQGSVYRRNVVALLIAMFYSWYALYASGEDAVFGAMIVMAIGYLLYGFIADRFEEKQNAATA
jgi:putrescine:ornithine antiporter